MKIALEVAVLLITISGVVVLLVLMLWGAREDGRDQRRYAGLVQKALDDGRGEDAPGPPPPDSP